MNNAIHYQTSDGNNFFNESCAKNHAKSLTDKKVVPVAADGSGEILATLQASYGDEANEETPAGLSANIMALAAGLLVTGAEEVTGNEPEGDKDAPGDTPPAPAEPEKVAPEEKAPAAATKPAAKKTVAKKPAAKKTAAKPAAVKPETVEKAAETTTNTEEK